MSVIAQHQDLDIDIFDDLFFDEEMSGTSSGSPESVENDFTNPLSSTLDPYLYDNLTKDHFWGSVLDELPDELSDSGNESGSPSLSVTPTQSQASGFADSSMDDFSFINENEYSKSPEDITLENLNPSIQNITSTPSPLPNNKVTTATSPVDINLEKALPGFNSSSDAPVKKIQLKVGNKVFTIVQKGNVSGILPHATPVKPSSLNLVTDHDYSTQPKVKQTETSSEFGMKGVQLTEEERKLLDLEKLVVPENVPLTKEEENTLKRIRRKIKNKHSASESRKRRKDYIDNLEKRVKMCTSQNLNLQKKVNSLSEDNQKLMAQMKQLQATILNQKQQLGAGAYRGTCLAILVLSFAFFVLPFNPMGFKFDEAGVTTTTAAPTHQPYYRSRTLLSIADGMHDVSEQLLMPGDRFNLAEISREDADLKNPPGNFTYPTEVRVELEYLLLTEDREEETRRNLDEYMLKIE